MLCELEFKGVYKSMVSNNYLAGLVEIGSNRSIFLKLDQAQLMLLRQAMNGGMVEPAVMHQISEIEFDKVDRVEFGPFLDEKVLTRAIVSIDGFNEEPFVCSSLDGIILSICAQQLLGQEIPLTAEDEVLATIKTWSDLQMIQLMDQQGDAVKPPSYANKTLEQCTLAELQQKLQDAIDKEAFEKCRPIQDEIDRRSPSP